LVAKILGIYQCKERIQLRNNSF